jgi:hypothetical protein
MAIEILKSNGDYEEFDREKLRGSLLRSSASLVTTNDVIKTVERKLKNGMTTSEIYRIAYSILNKKEKRIAMRYSVKRSVMDLGPTGFPFEKYISQIFKKKGYKTMVGVTLPGKCVNHEVDVIAYDENELILMEVKFHNQLSIKSDTKVALYVKARWDDLKDQPIKLEKELTRLPTRCILVTNTSFTDNSVEYAKCSDIGMISWDYPDKGSLFDLINDTMQHPITIITELSNFQKTELIKKDYITANQIVENPKILQKIGINQSKQDKIIQNIKNVCEIE